MGLFYIEKNSDESMLAIWEQEAVVSRGKKREQERLSELALLHTLFGRDVLLDHYPNGRPFLPHLPVHLSIAHTHRFTAVLTHPCREVGVDMESLERDFSAVELRALSDKEIRFLSPDREVRSLQLAVLWGAKEALFKCRSVEEVDFALQMEVEPFVPRPSGTLSAWFNDKNGQSAPFILKYKIISNHILVYVFA